MQPATKRLMPGWIRRLADVVRRHRKGRRPLATNRREAPSGPTRSGLAFAAGVGSWFLLPTLPPGWPIALVCGSSLLLAWRWPRLLPLTAFLLGLGWSHLSCGPLLATPFPADLTNQDLEVEGRVSGLPDGYGDGVRFLLAPEQVLHDGRSVPINGRLRLSWYRNAPELRAGERWRLQVRLKPPHGFMNPGSFDYERWLFQQRITATGHVLNRADNTRLDPSPGRFVLDRWRQGLTARLAAALGETGTDPVGEPRPASALLPALVLGDRAGLTPTQWEVFARTGTSHLIAISGLHVGLVAGLVLVLVRRLWSLSERACLSLPAPRAAAIAAMLAAVGYSALAGFAISTQRALVMLAVLLLALILGRTLRPFSALVLALVAVLLLDPASVLSYGFWLSFGAVGILLYTLGGRVRPARWLRRWGRAQWGIALGLLPLLLLLFGRASVIAPLVNLVAIPMFAIILPMVLAATLLTLAAGWDLPLALCASGLDLAYTGLAWLSALPLAAESISSRPAWAWAAAFAGVLVLLAPRGLPGRMTGWVMLTPLLLLAPRPPHPGQAEVTLLDVGQGLAAVVRTTHHALVYDVGPRYPSGFNTGDAVIAPFLRHQGIRRLDLIVVSHADRDHGGGLAGLIAELPPPTLLGSRRQTAYVLSAEPREVSQDLSDTHHPLSISVCRRGRHWNWDGVDFRIIHPDSHRLRGNNSSCVLRVSSGRASLLLTGDIEDEIEAELIERERARLASDLLAAPHHGSATSSSVPFITAVRPRWVIYSAGFANRFGFPVEEVRERYRGAGVDELNTADSGAIRFLLHASGRIDGPGRWRPDHPRLWRHQPSSD
jgi:competence protein ComEC